MIQPIKRWPHPDDLKPGAISAFLKEHEPLMGHEKNAELVRVLSWALPLYHRMEMKKALEKK